MAAADIIKEAIEVVNDGLITTQEIYDALSDKDGIINAHVFNRLEYFISKLQEVRSHACQVHDGL